ncbi:MAG TPA: glycosyltransferase family 4 protein [Geobacterales bacterium]|nr:glycosyltransferase family 4 protein [Geobacterales bacterium]
MRLAYLLSEYPTLGHTYLLREVRQLRELDWDIQTISIRRPGNRTSPLSPAEVEEWRSTWYILGGDVLGLLMSHVVTFVTRPLRYLRGLATAWRFGRFNPRQTFLATAYFVEAVGAGHRLRRAGINYVHSVYSTTVALILSRVFDVNLSMTFHGPAEFTDPEGFAIREKVRAAQLVCSISYFGKSQIMLWSSSSDWQKLEVAPLGVEISGWQTADFREHPAPFELVSVGRLVEIKGFPLLLDAVAQLRSEGREVRLTLAGDGPDRAGLESQARRLGIADRVVFAGWKNQDDLRQLYLASDVCVLSSFAEGVPVVLMEAMATGVPCVAPRINGIPELIRDGVDGLLFTASDVQELVAAIGKLMDNPGLRRCMAESSPRRVADKYNVQKNVRRLSEIFKHWMRRQATSSGI